MGVGLARLTDGQRTRAGQFALEHAVDPNAIFDLHRALEERAATDDRVERLAAAVDRAVFFFT